MLKNETNDNLTMKYKIPFVDAPRHYKTCKKELDTAIHDVLSRGDLILRKDLKIFENRFARYIETKYAIGVNSGFDALHLSLKAAGVGSGDEVITVAHTFIATISAIIHNGALPVLIDIGEDFNMDTTQIEKAITKKTKAIIPVHLNGRSCNMKMIMEIAHKHKLLVIEDAAQALGASYNSRKTGAFGIAGCFSFYPFKMLGAFGDGGAVTTNNKTIAQKIKWLRDHGQDREQGKLRMYGFNARLDNLQAAILNVKLKYYAGWVARRRKIAHLYYTLLKGIPEIILPHFAKREYFDVYQNYVIRAQRRNELTSYLKEKGIEVLIKSMDHHHQQLKEINHFKLPKTDKTNKEVISLPLNTEITDEQLKYIIKVIQNFYHTVSSKKRLSLLS